MVLVITELRVRGELYSCLMVGNPYLKCCIALACLNAFRVLVVDLASSYLGI